MFGKDTIQVAHESVQRVVSVNPTQQGQEISPITLKPPVDTTTTSINVPGPSQSSSVPLRTQQPSSSVVFQNTMPQAPSPEIMPMPKIISPPMRQVQPPPFASPVQVDPNFHDDTFLDLANPTKMTAREEPDDDTDNIHLEDDTDAYNAPETQYQYQSQPFQPQPTQPFSFQTPSHLIPREPFSTIDEEKSDILNKLFHMRKKGYHPPKQFSMVSDIRELRAELDQIAHSFHMENGVKFARKMLVASVTGLEFLNKRFDPFNLQLEGWSENVMENINDFDSVFERLVQKYSGKGNAPPEIELLLILVGSAMMFHLTNSLFKQNIPAMGDVLKQNPDILSNIMKSMQGKKTEQPTHAPQNTPVAISDDMSDTSTEVEYPMDMKGPDLSSFHLPANTLPPNRIPSRELEDEMSSMADTMSEISDISSDISEIMSETGVMQDTTRRIKVLPPKKKKSTKKT